MSTDTHVSIHTQSDDMFASFVKIIGADPENPKFRIGQHSFTFVENADHAFIHVHMYEIAENCFQYNFVSSTRLVKKLTEQEYVDIYKIRDYSTSQMLKTLLEVFSGIQSTEIESRHRDESSLTYNLYNENLRLKSELETSKKECKKLTEQISDLQDKTTSLRRKKWRYTSTLGNSV